MPNYLRAYRPNGTFFFTVVTYRRRPLLTLPEGRRILRQVIVDVRQEYPFEIDAWVLLPEHLHCIWTLPPGDSDFSKRWGLIKARFTKRAGHLFRRPQRVTASRVKHRDGTVWQRRFWEHCLRDQDDFNRHMDYIHWNPVKHGHVCRVADWPFSTFHRYVANGVYTRDWGAVDSARDDGGDFGE
jgi:putative transposase